MTGRAKSSSCEFSVMLATLMLTACEGSAGVDEVDAADVMDAPGGADVPGVDPVVGRWLLPSAEGERTATFTADGQYAIPAFDVASDTERGSWSRRDRYELDLQCTERCPVSLPFESPSRRTVDVRVNDRYLMFGSLYTGSSQVSDGAAWSAFYFQISSVMGCNYRTFGAQLRLTDTNVTSLEMSSCTPGGLGLTLLDGGTWASSADGLVVNLSTGSVTYFLLDDALGTTRWNRAP